MWSLILIAAAIYSHNPGMPSIKHTSETRFEANVRLPNGSYQRVTIKADMVCNAKVILQQQYCPEKKNCVVSGPHLTR